MSPPTPPAEPVTVPARWTAERAAAALRDGRLVAFPTETVYGIGAHAGRDDALTDLARLTGRAGDPSRSGTWHAPEPDDVLRVLELAHPLHRRLVRNLLPGAVTFRVREGASDLDAALSRLGARPGAVDARGAWGAGGATVRELGVRVPDHATARDFLSRAWALGAPVAGEGLAAAGLGDGRTPDALFAGAPGASGPAITAGPAMAGIAGVIDDGPARLGRPSSVVRLLPGGTYEVVREQAVSAREVERAAELRLLFVCTGNTCRSPMAEAIAAHLLRERGVPRASARSAGAAAAEGQPVTPEALRALKRLGVEPTRARARELTRQAVGEAQVVFAMTQSHARAVLGLDPRADVRLLDPDGQDVPDPIGGPLEAYVATAERLRELIARRLDELAD